MQTTIGSDQPPALSEALNEAALRRFAAAMEELGHRRDRAATMATFVASMAGFPAGVPATIPALLRFLPPPRMATGKQLRNLLNCEGWDLDELRLELVAAGFEGGVDVILIEAFELRDNTPRPYDLLSVHLLGSGSYVPVGWRRGALPKGSDGEGPDISDVERRSVVELLTQLQSDCDVLGLPVTGVPVVMLDWRSGDNEELRTEITELGFEFLVEVGPEYAGFDQSGDPFASQVRRPMLFEQMPFADDGSVPVPRLLRSQGRSHEFVAAMSRAGSRTYAIAGPRIASAPGSLVGHRARRRAAELVDLASRVRTPRAAQCLRIADLRSTDERPWQAAAFLISACQATLMARFPKGGS